jgi:hypothetical protein
MSLDQLADHGWRLAQSFLLARGDLPSLVVAYRAGDASAAVPLVWSDAEERVQRLAQIREIFATIGVDAYVVAQEILVVEAPAHPTGLRDTDDHGSREGLRVIAANRDGAAVIRIGFIERDPTGHPMRIETEPTHTPADAAGDLADLASLWRQAH